MSSWLEQLERELDERLSAFLRNNPMQEQLFSQQHQQDRAQALQRQRQQLQHEAEQQRRQLLNLAEEVRAWQGRIDKARSAGADALTERAQQHVNGLTDHGRVLWADLEDPGRRFREVDHRLEELQRQQRAPRPSSLEKDWALFEAQQELETMRRESGLS